MSVWTEILLTASCLEDDGPEDGPVHVSAIDQLNSWLRPFEIFPVQNPDRHGHSPGCCFAGRVKSLNHEAFIEAVCLAEWVYPKDVQLFLRGENDERFKEIDLTANKNSTL